MERRREQRSAQDAWSDEYRLSRVYLTRVRARTPMTRSEQRLMLLLWILSICTALLVVAKLYKLIGDLIRDIAQAF